MLIEGRNRTELDILAAKDLCEKMRKNDLNYGCLPTSIRSLGGDIHYYNIINKKTEMTQLFTVDKFDLEIGGFVEIDEPVDENYIQSTLEWLFEERHNFEGRDLAGLVVYRFYPDNKIDDGRELINHFFTIFPQETMSPKVRRVLEKENRYIVVDIAAEKPLGRTNPEEMADYMNQVMDIGGKFLLIQVYKK